MMAFIRVAVFLLLFASASLMAANPPLAIVIHGGAGTLIKANMAPAVEAEYRAFLTQSVQAGYAVLTRGGTSVEAVVAAVELMENSPLFNAGKGAVFSHDGKNELDASIMEGKDLNAGSVAGVSRIKNPIRLAWEVMSASEHVLLTGPGAEEFATQQGFELMDPSYFYTERRWRQLQNLLGSAEQGATTRLSEDSRVDGDSHKFGTVGAVALDADGNIAAGTSTGGMTNKRFGRVGDSPIIGAGTYADNDSCGISATGHGEFFIRAAVAHDICARVKYQGISLQQAADAVIQQKLVGMGGEGGVIGLDPAGNVVYSFNSPGMYRASIDAAGQLRVDIFK